MLDATYTTRTGQDLSDGVTVIDQVVEIPIAKVRPNPENPRTSFEPAKVKELADSIRAAGRLHQPVTVRYLPDEETGTDYEIVMGGRRFMAHELLAKTDDKWSVIRATIRSDMDDKERDIAAGVENLRRVDLNEMEEARYYGNLRTKHKMTPAQIAKALGQPKFRVVWRLSLLKLEPEIQKLVEIGQLPAGHALEIAKVESTDQIKLLRRYAAGKLGSMAQVKAAVDAILNKDAQSEMDTGEAADPADVAKLSGMEARIARFAELSQTGWKDGECQIASKVDPDRALKMAEELRAIANSLKVMERQLRQAHARRETVAEQEALPEAA